MPAAAPCPPAPRHHAIHHIVGRFRHRGSIHHHALKHSAATGCGKLPAGAPGALLPKVIPASIAVAAGAALLTAAASVTARLNDPGTLAGPTFPQPAWPPTAPPNDPGWPAPRGPHHPKGPPVPISEPSSTPLFAAAALLVGVWRLVRRPAVRP